MIRLLGAFARALRAAGGGRVLRLAQDAVDATGRPLLRAEVDGVTLRGFLRHRSFLGDLVGKGHERFVRSLLFDAVTTETTFVDVGAHVGLYTLLAARRAKDVVAFEADPYTARALRANAEGLANVRVVAKAASDRIGVAQFWPSPGTYGSSLFRRPSMKAERAIEVETTTIDAELAGAADVVAKIDAEGAEIEVLDGMTETLARARRAVVLVELNPVALREAGHDGAELVARLRELGLDVERVDEQAGAVVALADAISSGWKGNLLCRSGS